MPDLTIERLEEVKRAIENISNITVSEDWIDSYTVADYYDHDLADIKELIDSEIERQSAIKAKTDKIPRVKTLPASWDEENRTTEPIENTEQLPCEWCLGCKECELWERKPMKIESNSDYMNSYFRKLPIEERLKIIERSRVELIALSRQRKTISLSCVKKDCEVIGNIHDNPELMLEVTDENGRKGGYMMDINELKDLHMKLVYQDTLDLDDDGVRDILQELVEDEIERQTKAQNSPWAGMDEYDEMIKHIDKAFRQIALNEDCVPEDTGSEG